MIVIVVSVIAGLIGAFILWSLYKFAYVVFGLSLGLALGALISVDFNLGDLLALIMVVVLGLVGAVLGNMVGDLMSRLSPAFSSAGCWWRGSANHRHRAERLIRPLA